ncbi:MAG: hypothetical protein VKK62_04375 [Synechococcaceae cyanobacterium]|nr:hypothetical protein [Synechococcaceae cyanobacterium]
MANNADPIFLLSEDGLLQRVERSAYDKESLLQQLVSTYPDLLAGDQISPAEPLRWLCVATEVGISDAPEASDRWALDCLLIDSRCRPTLVEIKRSTDRRIRREVVGQMLDYAAHALLHWPVDRLRSLATERCGGSEQLQAEVGRLLDVGSQPDVETVEDFWTTVEDNLRHGRVRLLFVADELPGELRRIIEFLNGQMPDVEVLGVEIPLYAGSRFRALVPRLVGQGELLRQLRRTAAPRARSRTNRQAWLESLSPDVREIFEGVLDRAEAMDGVSLAWGEKNAIIKVLLKGASGPVSVLYLTPAGSGGRQQPALEFYLGYIQDPPMAEALKQALLRAGAVGSASTATLLLPVAEEQRLVCEGVVAAFWSWCSAGLA